jgi:hypothetical protein
VNDFWTIGPSGAERRLRLAGFSAAQAERLVALRLRYEAVDARDMPVEQRTALLQWFLDHGRHDEGLPRAGAGRSA